LRSGQRGFTLDRSDRHIAIVLAGIRRADARPPAQKEAILPEDLRTMLARLDVGALRPWTHLPRLSVGGLAGLRPHCAWSAVRRVVGEGKELGADRLADIHVAGLVKKCALAAGVRGDLSEGDRKLKFSGHSLRAGLASSAAVDERYVQKQLGHASAEMTRRYQRRRDRFRVNLTKAAGL
jgi:integrase